MSKKALLFGSLVALSACKISEPIEPVPDPTFDTPAQTMEHRPEPVPSREVYNSSKTRVNDLLHTRLEVGFDFENSYLNGKATLTLKPYFYPTDQLVLDAKGFDVHKVQLVTKTGNQELQYEYDNAFISIDLDREYSREEEYTVFIEYTAKPNELEEGGSAAITSEKGLYFINPDSSEVNKPTQVWTQGETEASSCWFPTIDSPNEKMTQEIYITVPEEFVTLSNGKLMYQTPNGDGTRTDLWKQDLPHAPYLTMLATGDFFVYEDSWTRSDGTKMPVYYYVEHEYADDAHAIFGNTPKMLSFYSDILGVEYPWDKYHQIIVRDYVSGAMENTGAVIFGEFVQQHEREMIDGDYEAVVAHELFHHWFGDLVTCESWSNLPLNESFADYSEYLWDEYESGRDAADHTWKNALNSYLGEASGYGRFPGHVVDMIRFDYDDKEDMFDSHSYSKGGRILHMLRKYVGDDAFFSSLQLYLEDNAYQAAEIHNLRLAFEEVTGEDLNWFFNQWFLDKGHPELYVEHSYNDTSNVLTLVVEQQQDFEVSPLYKIPVFVDIYANGKTERHEIVIEEVHQEFAFLVSTKPDLVNFDGEKSILCEREEIKSDEEWIFQFYNAPLYLDRLESLNYCAEMGGKEGARVVLDAMSDPYWHIRSSAIKHIKKSGLKTHFSTELLSKLMELATNDEDSDVRSQAIKNLSKHYPNEEETVSVFAAALKDSSYMVMNSGMKALADRDPEKAVELAKEYESEENGTIRRAVSEIYADYGGPEQFDFFVKTDKDLSAGQSYGFLLTFHDYLKKQDYATLQNGVEYYQQKALSDVPWWLRQVSVQLMLDMESDLEGTKNDLEARESALNEAGDNPSELAAVQQELKTVSDVISFIGNLYPEIKENETNEQVLQYLQNK